MTSHLSSSLFNDSHFSAHLLIFGLVRMRLHDLSLDTMISGLVRIKPSVTRSFLHETSFDNLWSHRAEILTHPHRYQWDLVAASLKVTACGDQGTNRALNHTAGAWHEPGTQLQGGLPGAKLAVETLKLPLKPCDPEI